MRRLRNPERIHDPVYLAIIRDGEARREPLRRPNLPGSPGFGPVWAPSSRSQRASTTVEIPSDPCDRLALVQHESYRARSYCNSSVKCRRARCTLLPGSMIAIVSAFRGVSTKADQAHIHFVSGSISVIAGARNHRNRAAPSEGSPISWLQATSRPSPILINNAHEAASPI